MSISLNNALANQSFHVELLNLYRENKTSHDGENMETLAIPSVEGKAMLTSWMRVLLNTSKRLLYLFSHSFHLNNDDYRAYFFNS